MIPKRALGKGLDALIPKKTEGISSRELMQIPVGEIIPNRRQPRQNMDSQELNQLSLSIKEKGLLQPVVVRKIDTGYELVAGGRRFEAAKLAGLKFVPALVKELDDKESFVLAIVENLQRSDLNPMEEALAFKRLMDEFNYSLDDIARFVSKDKTTVANALRLIKLPVEVRRALEKGLISRSQARTILSLAAETEQVRMLHEILSGGVTVREIERRAQEMAPRKKIDPFVSEVENKLQTALGTKVRVFNKKNNRGKIVLEYYSLDDLERILRRIG